MDTPTLIKLVVDMGMGGVSLALFFRLGKVVADHEIRIGALEAPRGLRRPRRRSR